MNVIENQYFYNIHKINRMRKYYSKALLLLTILFLIFTVGCQRETFLENIIDSNPPTTTPTVVNDLTQVTASVSGIVLDESNVPIASAAVTSGAATTTTDSNGMFIFQNISISKENGSVTAVKAGYFKGVRSFKTTPGKNHTVRLQLMQKVLSGTINAAAGGTINSNGGATIIFPAAVFVTSTGAAYTGTVNIYSRWINPTAANLPFIIPGDLRGVGTDGAENLLKTYGMVGAELEDASGNTLKIATGKKATISFPLPASLQASAPATIQLWHFDDATARWKENGTASKTGSTYTAQVDKFSFWNVDVGTTNFIKLDYTLINAATNSPLVSTSTRIKRVSNGSYGFSITNNSGFVSGLVPKNEALVLEVITTNGCNTILFSQNIGPFSTSTSIGNISVTIPAAQYISFIGTVVDCINQPVTNGYISMYISGGGGAFAPTNNSGAFAFTVLNCSALNLSYNYLAVNNTTTQISGILTGSASIGTINLGNISACITLNNLSVYVAGAEGNAKLWKDNTPNNIATRIDSSIANSVFVFGNDVYVAGTEGRFAKVWKNGVGANLSLGLNDAYNYVTSIFVQGLDVYVTGYGVNSGGQTAAKFWKNGVETYLTIFSNDYGQATSIFASGTDVYVAYNEKIGAQYFARIWKNGVITTLNSGTFNAYVNSIYVVGSDVYTGGIEYSSGGIAKIWKNGVPNSLGNGEVKSVFVLGNDVYGAGSGSITGSFSSIAKFWKNSVGTTLTNGTINSICNSIFVQGQDVYIAGKEGNIAKIWKNAQVTNLTNGSSVGTANSVFVK
jgi:hypothetical protein